VKRKKERKKENFEQSSREDLSITKHVPQHYTRIQGSHLWRRMTVRQRKHLATKAKTAVCFVICLQKQD
jgi:hypothetical protein